MHIDTENGKLYWHHSWYELFRSNLDGTNVEKLRLPINTGQATAIVFPCDSN